LKTIDQDDDLATQDPTTRSVISLDGRVTATLLSCSRCWRPCQSAIPG